MGAAATTVIDEIPVIDLAQPLEGVAAAVREACLGSGFFYIRSHGVDSRARDEVFAANRRFHALPDATKLAIKLNKWHRGFQPMATSKLVSSARFAPAAYANQLESFFIRHELERGDGSAIFDGPNQWPDDPAFRIAVTRFDDALRDLGHRMLRVFSVAVGEAPTFFDRSFAPASTCLRLIHYPPAPVDRPQDEYGIHPHTDYGFLTLLAQDDVGGLEVRRPDGSWIAAKPIAGTFVCNVGDVLARWTNDRFNSTPHRVINPTADRDRYSVAMFFDPNVDATIACLPQFAGERARHAPVRYGDYYRMRLEANYPDRVGVQK